MRIGYLLPSGAATGSPFSGVLRLAQETVRAVTDQGVAEAIKMTPWIHSSELALDVIHAFGGPNGYENAPLTSGAPWVLSPIHDSQQSTLAYKAAIWIGSVHARVVTAPAEKQRLYRQVARLVVLSEDERQRIAASCGIATEKISVVNAAVGPPQQVTDDMRSEVRRRLELPEKFVFAACDYGAARKNMARGVKAAVLEGIPIVLAGNPMESDELKVIRQLSADSAMVKLLGALNPSDLRTVMSMTTVYLQPSLEEGAGLAAMEAATYGARVVASDVGGIVDHLGPGAQYVTPTDLDSIRAGIRHEWCSGESNRVEEFVLTKRSWENSVSQLMAAYTAALA